ncbi:ABC transporter substrate-binding protein [Neobacillus sp. OS1-2]|uniref:ABC transporter substrate-binding protein n=1 Tax=Neobacillus sp. OS1-2 TaxID=3070680 RepID=UPI0027E14B68|nr:ABC transporter substrate-binding protein [Neobacillus sp. OS1-2]WML39734.1 ABC transporter substrate-binding protein [Neobacillus sp. OS1-2]
MKKKLSILVLISIMILGLFGCSTSSSSDSNSKDAAKIGVILPLSGPLAQLGNDVMRGFEIAKDIANEEDGVLGKKVEFAVADAPDSNSATSSANRLIQNDKVSVIAGSYSSAISFAASQVAERNKVVYWEQGAVADDITSRGFKYLFRLIYPASDLGRAAADYLVKEVSPKLNMKNEDIKVAIVHEDSSYGTMVAKGATEVVNKAGMKLVATEAYSYKTNDLSSTVSKLKSLQPDVVIACQYTADGILFWRQAKEAGLNLKAFIGNGGAHNIPDFAAAVGDEANGIFNAGTSSNFNTNGLNDDAKKLYKEFQDRYASKYKGKTPSAHAAMGFNAMYLLLKEVIPEAGSLKPEKIREAALAMDKPIGSTIVGWGVKFDPKTQNNTLSFPMIDQWQKQKVVTIFPKEFGLTDKVTIPLPEWGNRANVGE